MDKQKTTNLGREPKDDEVLGVAANLQLILEQTDVDVVPTIDELDLLLHGKEANA